MLTDEEIDDLWMASIPTNTSGTEWRRALVRDIEQAAAGPLLARIAELEDLERDARRYRWLAAHPTAGIWVPAELAERVQETMGEFLMDHSWRQQDMDTSDEFGALLAVATKAEPLQQPERVPLTEDQIVGCLVSSGCLGTVKMSYDSGPYEITRTSINADDFARAIEAAHGIKPKDQSND